MSTYKERKRQKSVWKRKQKQKLRSFPPLVFNALVNSDNPRWNDQQVAYNIYKPRRVLLCCDEHRTEDTSWITYETGDACSCKSLKDFRWENVFKLHKKRELSIENLNLTTTPKWYSIWLFAKYMLMQQTLCWQVIWSQRRFQTHMLLQRIVNNLCTKENFNEYFVGTIRACVCVCVSWLRMHK